MARPAWLSLYRRPWLLPFLALAVTIACGLVAFPLRVANDLEALMGDDPAYRLYQDFLSKLGSDESVAVFHPIERLSGPALLDLHDLNAAICRLPSVRRAASLLDLVPREITASRSSLAEWTTHPRSLARLEESIARTRLASRLVSRNPPMLSLVARLDVPSGGGPRAQLARRTALADLKRTCAAHYGARPYYLLGYPVIEERVLGLVQRSNTILVPLAVLVGSGVLWLVFRRVLFVVTAMGAILSALVWTTASFKLRDYTLNPFSTMLFPLLLTVGLTTTIYVLSAYRRFAREHPGVTGEEMDLQVLPEVFPPTLLCTTTTFIGFLSLAWTDVPEMRNFGIYDAAGTVLCLVSIFAIIPPLLRLAGFGRLPEGGPAAPTRDPVESVLVRLVRAVCRRHRTVLALAGAAVAASCVGLAIMPIESASIGGLYADDPVIVAKRLYERAFEPVFELEMMVRLPRQATFLDLDGFHAMTKLQRALEKVPGVQTTFSFADLLLDAASYVAKSRKDDVATDRELELLARFLATDIETDLLDGFLSDERRLARLRVTTLLEGSLAILGLADRATGVAVAALPPGSTVDVTGRHVLSAIAHRETMSNEVSSFALALAGILAMMALVFGSPRVALAAAVPNALPLLFTYGTMGWLGIPFNISTGMIPCVLIGLVVDDTIHALFRYRAERERLSIASLAVRRTIRHVGRAVLSTALVLAAGLLVMAFSRFRMIVQFGVLMALTIGYGVVTELLVTPALLTRFPGLLAPPRVGTRDPI